MKPEQSSRSTLDVSVVVPVKNEVDSVAELVKRVSAVLKNLDARTFGGTRSVVHSASPAYRQAGTQAVHSASVTGRVKENVHFEIVFVDDGSSDGTWQKIESIHTKNKAVRGLRFRRNFGKSAALMAGFAEAHGAVIITMDGDLQDDPDEIPHFLAKIDDGFDMVSGWKKTRHDPIHKTLPSRVMNWLAGELTGARVHDMNCGFKAYRRETALDLDLYGDLYRFIPAFAVARGWRLAEIPVKHHARRFGQSKYGFRRFITGWFDLLTVTFLTAYRSRPSHFFGVFGLALLLVGSGIDLYLMILRLATGSIQFKFPLLVFGTTLLLVGLQLILFGLLAELITAKRDRRSLYEIKESLE